MSKNTSAKWPSKAHPHKLALPCMCPSPLNKKAKGYGDSRMKDKKYLTSPAAWLGVQMYIHLGWGEDPGQRGIQPVICMKVHNKGFETLTE